MQLTNQFGIPETFVRAIERHTHEGAEYSASQISLPVRIKELVRRYNDQLSEDVTDRIWQLIGSSIHYVLQKGEGQNDLVEEFLTEPITLPNNVSVPFSGTVDLFEPNNKKIIDYKITSVWSYVYGSRISEWTEQINCYAYLLRRNMWLVESGSVIMIFRDWNKNKATEKDYPPTQVIEVPVEIWSEDQQRIFIGSRLAQFEQAKLVEDHELPFCTPHERWESPDSYAVMKKGRKSAVRVLPTQDDAEQYMMNNNLNSKHYIEFRKGQPRRCDKYCPVVDYCNQRQNELRGVTNEYEESPL
jgi:hypothetical protein